MLKKIRPPRTAILIVHGMGSQRPMETARGVFGAVWFDNDTLGASGKQFWTHPEQSGNDIDLPTITTNVTSAYGRAFDFHEMYWAHLMEETRGVAVLLWLFELVKKGPRLKENMRLLWWASAIFMGLLSLAVAQLILTIVARIANPAADEFHAFLTEPLALAAIISLLIAVACLMRGAATGAFIAGAIFVFSALCLIVGLQLDWFHTLLEKAVAGNSGLAKMLAPLLLATVTSYFLMGFWGLLALLLAYPISLGIFGIVNLLDGNTLHDSMPWAIGDAFSTIGSALLILFYLAINAVFLVPYLGDAARYFRNAPGNVAVRREIRRQAVNMLETLHLSRDYDRIIVVAHSLGTVIAYDMLRAYFGRIAKRVRILATSFGEEFEALDYGSPTIEEQRLYGRRTIAKIADAVTCLCNEETDKLSDSPRAWLVTDFVTLGSPLTHVYYLLCDLLSGGNDEEALRRDFVEKVRQRDFPTCPPQQLPDCGRVTYRDQSTNERLFHHGALFALTRWKNLYFKASELIWGDAIGGPVAYDTKNREMFGANVEDQEICTNSAGKRSFFAHVKYWDVNYPEGREAPHLVALRRAIDLGDEAMKAAPSRFARGIAD